MKTHNEKVISWPEIIWRQFEASITMLENALRAYPDELWGASLWAENTAEGAFSQSWYIAYHTLFWLDLYLSGAVEGFAPPPPFTLDELDPAGLLPDRQYSKDELLSYLHYGRQKCHIEIATLTDEKASRRCRFPWVELSYGELLLDNMRHVQEHGAQLNLFLGQQNRTAASWITQTKGNPSLP